MKVFISAFVFTLLTVDNGVWIVSKYAEGPWQVSEERPSEVEKIPAIGIDHILLILNIIGTKKCIEFPLHTM